MYHDNIFSATDAQPLEVTAVVTDDIGVTGVTLCYRVQGAASFTELAMTATGEGKGQSGAGLAFGKGGHAPAVRFSHVYTAVIPAEMVTELGLEYYTKGNVTFHSTPDDPQFVVIQPRTIGMAD